MQTHTPSDTAQLIARSIVLMERDSVLKPLVPAGDGEKLLEILRQIGPTRWLEHFASFGWGRAIAYGAERIFQRGILLHFLARKRWIEEQTRQAIAGGARRVVVLGAGFDLLAWRLSRQFPEVGFFELDHPATQAPKHRALKSARVAFLAVDLSQKSVREALQTCPNFEKNEPTVFIAEGLLMYLPPEKVTGLLYDLAIMAGPLGGVIFSFMRKTQGGSIAFENENRLVGWWLNWKNEPFQWGCAISDLADFLGAAGLWQQAFADHEILKKEILAPLHLDHHFLARGECLCHCVPISDESGSALQ